MKTAEVKTTATTHNYQSKTGNQPFFEKAGELSFFSEASPDIQTKPFFNVIYNSQNGFLSKKSEDKEVNHTILTPSVQAKCAACEAEEKEEKLQRKGERPEKLEEEPQIQEKPIFESEGVEEKVQTKTAGGLTVGQPDDKYEREADAMADKVVQKLSTPETETKEEEDNRPELQTKPEIQERSVSPDNTETAVDKVPSDKNVSRASEAPAINMAPLSSAISLIQPKCKECEEKETEETEQQPELQKKTFIGMAAPPPDDDQPNIQCRALEMEKTEYPIMFKRVPGIQLQDNSRDEGTTRKRIVEEAQKMVGKIEAKKNDGSGRRVGAEHLLKVFHLAAKDAWPDEVIENVRYTQEAKKFPHWCGIFSVYAIKKAGIDLGYWKPGEGVGDKLQPTENPQPGDIGYFHEKQHHCIIKAVNGDVIESIDGNSGNFSEVVEKTRPRSAFIGGFLTAFTGSEKYIQRKEEASTSQTPVGPSLEDKLSAKAGKGSPMDETTRSQMESGFGADFSGVNIHTDSDAVALNKSLNAQAFTHGSDIYFNEGKYNPETSSGKHLLVHELTHTVQQGEVHKSIQRNGEACYPDEEIDDPLACEVDYTPHDATFKENGVNLDIEDLTEVAIHFPDGIQLLETELFVLVQGEGYANSVKIGGYRVSAPGPVNSGINIFVLQIGKGRAILVSSRSGGNIMLDAGAGTSRTSNSDKARRIGRDVNNLLLSGLAGPPSRITISHVDLDHYNAVQEVLNLPQMRNVDVRITRQQLMEAIRSGNWQTMNIQFSQSQKLVRINVSGMRGVHVDRAFIGGMEITEFRSEAAHQQLTDTSRVRYNKNSTSEVTVVRDFLTNTTHIFTGDGEGRTFHEIIDMVGNEAFRRIMGGGSRNLASVEYPHHGGSVTSGPNTRGMVEFLRLAFEASDGRVNFFTQTSQRFSGTDSASINYLDAVEIPVERITEGSNTGNTTQVRRISGQNQEQITIDRGRITEILNLANANASRVMEAQQTRHKLASLIELVIPVERALTLEGTRAEFRQLGNATTQLKTNIETSQTSLNNPWNQYWQVMIAEAETTGMRASTTTQRVTNAVNALQNQVNNTNTTSFENDVNSLYNGLNIYQRLLTNSIAMMMALNEGRLGDLRTLKAEQRNLLARSVSILGRAEVSRQVRSAWSTIREVWTGRMIRSVARRLGHYSAAHRHMMTDFRVVLNENIVNQARLNQLVEQASHGALPMSPNRTIPMRTRIGAGFMAAIEVLRMGLEFYESVEAASEAEELRDIQGRAEGLQDINRWQRLGAHPTIELVEKGSLYGWNIVSSGLSNNSKYEILNGTYSGEAPEFDKAVVANISDEDLEFVVGRMTIELITMNDWVSRFGHPESGGGPIKKFSNGWGVKLWDEEDEKYSYFLKDVIQEPLNALYSELEANLEQELEYEADDPNNRMATVEDTAIFGTDRYVYVYDGGHLKRLDFEERAPKFFVIGGPAPTNYDLTKVKAADIYTYNRLSRYNTIEIVDGIPYNTINIFSNPQGYGYVDTDNVQYYLSNIMRNAIRNVE